MDTNNILYGLHAELGKNLYARYIKAPYNFYLKKIRHYLSEI